jgi:hypothetical protein
MKTLTWPQIANNFLKNNNFDCLKNNDKKCYCQVDGLFQCAFDAFTFYCTPGKIKELSGEFKRV